MNKRLRSLAATLAVALTVPVAGCDGALYDFWGTRREETANLLVRVENGDEAAYAALVDLTAKSKTPDPLAAAQLGYIHHVGMSGHVTDLRLAKSLYDQASGTIKEADYNAGLIELGQGNYEAAVSRFRTAAGKERDGMTIAMVQLAKIYEAGKAGAPRSASLAAEWYEYAALRGDLYAKSKLGLILIDGRGRTPDIQRGLALLEQAAIFGNRDSRIALSSIYAKPTLPGVEVNRELAAQWLIVASDGSPKLEQIAEAYVQALTPQEKQAVLDAVGLFRKGHKGIVEPEDFNTPLRVARTA